jgi:hypothetical protein
MISRFFKKKTKATPSKKKAMETPKEQPPQKGKKTSTPRLLTAEGWKRMMMRKEKK